jgi:hypothetical protein
MKAKVLSSEEIRVRGLRLLGKELGPYNLVRFIQQYKTGRGDHTKDRHAHLDKLSVEEIYSEIKTQRKHSCS